MLFPLFNAIIQIIVKADEFEFINDIIYCKFIALACHKHRSQIIGGLYLHLVAVFGFDRRKFAHVVIQMDYFTVKIQFRRRHG